MFNLFSVFKTCEILQIWLFFFGVEIHLRLSTLLFNTYKYNLCLYLDSSGPHVEKKEKRREKLFDYHGYNPDLANEKGHFRALLTNLLTSFLFLGSLLDKRFPGFCAP